MSRVPDFFIVGHPRSGTDAVYELLRRHPLVFMPDVQEPRWFTRSMPGTQAQVDSYEEYLALFDGAAPGQVAGEATATYIWSPSAAAEIARVQPRARIVVILREPATYLRALHLGLLQAGVETETGLLGALELESTRRGARADGAGQWPWALQYTRHVRYVEQLRHLQACFGGDRVLAIVYDDLRADTEASLRGLLRFLGADDGGPLDARLGGSTSAAARSGPSRLDEGQARDARGVGGRLAAVAPASLRERVRAGVTRQLLFTRPRPSDAELLLELRHRFRPEVEALSDHLHRDLVALWGYRGIA